MKKLIKTLYFCFCQEKVQPNPFQHHLKKKTSINNTMVCFQHFLTPLISNRIKFLNASVFAQLTCM